MDDFRLEVCWSPAEEDSVKQKVAFVSFITQLELQSNDVPLKDGVLDQ